MSEQNGEKGEAPELPEVEEGDDDAAKAKAQTPALVKPEATPGVAPAPVVTEPVSRLSALGARLKEYKETIAIVVFFFGPFVWFNATFATKIALGDLKCIQGANMRKLSYDAAARDLSEKIAEGNIDLDRIQAAKPLDIISIEKKKEAIEDLKKTKDLDMASAQTAGDEADRCGK